MIWIVNMVFVYTGFLGLGILLVIAKQIQDKKSVNSCIQSVCVIVPFRNESSRIRALLQSLNDAYIPEELDLELIFVDDNSTDYSDQILKSELKKQFKLIKNSGKGKKAAIHTALLLTEKKYLLTFDADVTLPANYFEALLKVPEDDLVILPVNMKRESLFQKLAAVEFSWLQTLTFTAAKIAVPILANGANLLFSKKAYLEVYEDRVDLEIASGDDIYLLKALTKNKYSIGSEMLQNLRVETEAPKDWTSLIHQRKRWLSKMKGTFGIVELIGAVCLCVYAFGFIFPLLFLTDSYLAIAPLAIKISLDLILLIEERKTDFGFKDVLAVLAFQFWYPIYLVGLLFPIKGQEKRWNS